MTVNSTLMTKKVCSLMNIISGFCDKLFASIYKERFHKILTEEPVAVHNCLGFKRNFNACF